MKLNKFLMGVFSVAIGFSTVSCNDDDDYFINTTGIITEVTTGGAQTTATTAVVTGTVKDLSSQDKEKAYTVGAVYGTDEQSLLTSGTRRQGTLEEDGCTVTTSLTGLRDGVTYYYATFVTLQGKVTEYGDIKAFVTTDSQIGTADAASVTGVSANLGATLNGVNDLLEQGMEHGIILASDPSKIADGVRMSVTDASNSYTVEAKQLIPNTQYHYAAYMVMNDAIVIDPAGAKTFTTEKFYDPSNEESALYVDMGLDKDWATCNLGAATPSEQGALIGYGDITGLMRSTSADDYAKGMSISDSDNDVAKVAGAGMMPTAADWQNLLANSDVTTEDVEGAKMLRVTSKITGNSILLPVIPAREGENFNTNYGGYWTGSISNENETYAKMYVAGDGLSENRATVNTGLAVRPVRTAPYRAPKIDNNKIVFGDLENNGKIRIEIFNQYGTTGSASPLNTALLSFSKNMTVTFRISGLSGTAASGTYKAGLSYASGDWSQQTWGDSSVDVKGNGVYTVSWNAAGQCDGAAVWVIDIDGLGTAIGDDKSALKCEVLSIDLDYGKVEFVGKNVSGDVVPVFGSFNNAKMPLGDIEGNGNYRIELYNEYGASKANGTVDTSLLSFSKDMAVTVEISGLNGAAASKSYQAGLSYAEASWGYQIWGDDKITVEGDGVYTFTINPNQACSGAAVWVIDIPGMSSDLDNKDAVIVNVKSIVLDDGATVIRGHGISKAIFDNSKLRFGDLEGNGKIRLDIYNEYGDTGSDCGLDKSLVNFSDVMTLTFRISGLSGAAASGSYTAALSYVSDGWAFQDWGTNIATVNGDGEYTISLSPGQACTGATVWCVDIDGLGAAIGDDKSNLKCEIVSIKLDNGFSFVGK